MLDRNNFLDLEINLRKIKIYGVEEFYEIADSFITYSNAIDNNPDILLRLEMIKKSEEKLKEIIQVLLAKINPDMNWLIALSNQKNSSYQKLTDGISIILDGIDKQKEVLRSNLLNKSWESNKITNKLTIDTYSSSLKNLVSGLVYNPLKNAHLKFISLHKEVGVAEINEKEIIISQDTGNNIGIKRDKNLFWFIVFSYMLGCSQIIGLYSSQNGQNNVPRTMELREIQRLRQQQIQMVGAIQKLQVVQQQAKESDGNNKKEDGDGDSEESSESEADENSSTEESEESEPEVKEEVLKPENMYFPAVNGGEEKNNQDEEDLSFEENELNEEGEE